MRSKSAGDDPYFAKTLAVIKYGMEHGQFKAGQLADDLGLNNRQFQMYALRTGILEHVAPGAEGWRDITYQVKVDAIGIYINREGLRQAERACRYAAVACWVTTASLAVGLFPAVARFVAYLVLLCVPR